MQYGRNVRETVREKWEKMRWRMAVTAAVLLVVGSGFPGGAAAETNGDEKQKAVYQLDDIVVSATRTEKRVDDAPASVSVITRKDIDTYKISTVDEAVKYEAGIYAKRTKGVADAIPSVNMRGLYGQDRSLVLLNGVPLNEGYNGGVMWNAVSMDAVERIEVIRGPGSSLYGGNAMGGVINIITREPDDLEASVYGGYGSNATYKYGALAGNRYERFRVRVGAEVETTDGYPTTEVQRSISSGTGSLYGGYGTTSTSGTPKWVVGDKGDNYADRTNINAMLSYELSRTGKLSFDFQRGLHEYGYDAPNTYLRDAAGYPSYSGAVDLGGGQRASVSPNNYIYYTGVGHDELFNNTFKYEDRFGDVDFTGSIGYQFRNKWYTTNKAGSGEDYNTAPGSLSDGDTDTWVADLQGDIPLGDSHLLTAGLYFRTNTYDGESYDLAYYRNEETRSWQPTELTHGKDRLYAVYVQDEWRIADPVTVYAGIRYDWWEAFDGRSGPIDALETFDEPSDATFSPKLSAVWNPLDGTYVRASAARAFRAPNIYELYRSWVSGSTIYHSNPDLKPETLWNYEIGADQYFWQRKIKLSAAYFYSELDDAIESYRDGSDNYKENVAKARIQGVELEAALRPLDWLSIWANYTYNDTKVLENKRDPSAEGNALTMVPERSMNVGARAVWKGVAVSLAGDYQGRMYTSSDNSDVDDVYGAYSQRWLWNAKIAYAPVRRFEISFAVDNVFDEDYYQYYMGRERSYYGEIKLKY